MRKDTLNCIIKQIDEFRSFHVKVRARFPYLSESVIGTDSIKLPAFYKNEGIDLLLKFDREIDNSIREENNAIGHFANQNFILRLFAIMNYYGFVGDNISLVKESPGFQEVDILRRLRHIYAHSLGKFNPENDDHVKLKQVIQERFSLDVPDYDDFPLNIHAVIDAIIDGCKSYYRNQLLINSAANKSLKRTLGSSVRKSNGSACAA